ncbi:MAG: hypothetical protein FGF50_08600 [Candidatus Brockarchaeota archaeon]|nr:hypothetical protein [Candidatus Brockarchaeota archaeon]
MGRLLNAAVIFITLCSTVLTVVMLNEELAWQVLPRWSERLPVIYCCIGLMAGLILVDRVRRGRIQNPPARSNAVEEEKPPTPPPIGNTIPDERSLEDILSVLIRQGLLKAEVEFTLNFLEREVRVLGRQAKLKGMARISSREKPTGEAEQSTAPTPVEDRVKPVKLKLKGVEEAK